MISSQDRNLETNDVERRGKWGAARAHGSRSIAFPTLYNQKTTPS
jgi:hypothetical protein